MLHLISPSHFTKLLYLRNKFGYVNCIQLNVIWIYVSRISLTRIQERYVQEHYKKVKYVTRVLRVYDGLRLLQVLRCGHLQESLYTAFPLINFWKYEMQVLSKTLRDHT